MARIVNNIHPGSHYLSGFSLIEILVALTILSIVLLPFLGMVSQRIRKERENNEIIEAVEIAKAKMEEILLLSDAKDSEEIVESKYLVKVKILDGDKHDEPANRHPVEIQISVLRYADKSKLFELRALK